MTLSLNILKFFSFTFLVSKKIHLYCTCFLLLPPNCLSQGHFYVHKKPSKGWGDDSVVSQTLLTKHEDQEFRSLESLEYSGQRGKYTYGVILNIVCHILKRLSKFLESLFLASMWYVYTCSYIYGHTYMYPC